MKKKYLLPMGTIIKAEIDRATFALASNEIQGRIESYDPNNNYWVRLENGQTVLVYEEQITELL